MNRRVSRTEHGFTLVELLTAMAIVVIGLMATAMAFQYARSGIEAGRGETLATFLAEHKLEALKALALVDWTNVALQPGTTTEYCQPTSAGCTQAPSAGWYRRDTTVANTPGGTCRTQCKVVRVTVFYRPISAEGQLDQERRVDVVTVFAPRT